MPVAMEQQLFVPMDHTMPRLAGTGAVIRLVCGGDFAVWLEVVAGFGDKQWARLGIRGRRCRR